MPDTSKSFELLADDIRRRVLILLCDTNEIRVPEAIQARSQAIPSPANGTALQGDSAGRQYQAVDLHLHHTHLPKLEAEDLITWDREQQLVSRGPAFEEIEPLLHLLAANPHMLPGDLF